MKLNDLKIKPKTCRECKQKFIPIRAIQPVCSDFKCMVAYANKSAEKAALAREKKSKREHKAKIEKAKNLTEVAHETQRFFNQYIRERDKAAGYGCISCGTKNPNIQYCAGHFRSRGATSKLRFHEDNVHLQCNYHCNSQLSGNIGNYRIELIKRIGLERVEALENDNATYKWTREELIALKTKYKQLTKKLKESQS
jgi:hypothetical protein